MLLFLNNIRSLRKKAIRSGNEISSTNPLLFCPQLDILNVFPDVLLGHIFTPNGTCLSVSAVNTFDIIELFVKMY